MKKETEQYFDKAISLLNKMGIENKDIVVTGSVALDILGVLPEKHKIHDFDCIINISNDKLPMFNLICEIFRAEGTSYYTYPMLEIDGIKLNVFVNDSIENAIVEYKGVKVNGLMSILKKKKEYKRVKDYQDINDIVKNILI